MIPPPKPPRTYKHQLDVPPKRKVCFAFAPHDPNNDIPFIDDDEANEETSFSLRNFDDAAWLIEIKSLIAQTAAILGDTLLPHFRDRLIISPQADILIKPSRDIEVLQVEATPVNAGCFSKCSIM